MSARISRRSEKNTVVAILIIAVLYLLTLSPAFAIDPVNKTSDGVAIKGYDPVAYFTDRKPVRGSRDFEYVWMGAKWRFSTAGHKDLFIKDPDKYAPKYGGYCAYAVSQGTTADIDPDAWNIVDGRLYINLSKRIKDKWSKDIPGYIKKADEKWPNVLKK
ncbi:MAG: YHS domain-containing (seleno)protein [Thermodesulfovibrionales bacterium]